MNGAYGEATGNRDGGDTAAGGAHSMVRGPLTLAQVLELAGYGPDELLSVLVIRPGNPEPAPGTGLRRPAELVALAEGLEGANLWHSLSTFRPKTSGRGKAEDVVRMPFLWADLDIKAKGITTWAEAWALIEALSEILGTRPMWVTMTGHGLQPAWGIDPEESTDVLTLRPLLKRFGLLVRHVARVHGHGVDSVFNPDRVLRASGTWNLKDPDHPVQAQAYDTGGAPLGLTEILEALEACDIPARVEDYTAAEPFTVDRWEFADRSCRYVLTMIEGWSTDDPGEKHPWLLKGVTRLTAAYRAGCVSEASYFGGLAEIEDRMKVVCAPDPLATGELRKAQEERLARVKDEIHNPLHGVLVTALSTVESLTEEGLCRWLGKCHRERLTVFEYMADLEARGGAQ